MIPLKTIVVVIPKETLPGTCPAKHSFGMTLSIQLYAVVFTNCMLYFLYYGIMPKEDLAGLHSHKFLLIQQGEPSYLAMSSKPCTL